MLVGWKELTTRQANPNFNPAVHKYWDRWIEIPTGEIECPDCHFKTDVNDFMGIHTCPELKDGHGTLFTIGDEVYVFAKGRIRRGRVSRWKKETGMLSITGEDAEGYEQKYVVNHMGKVLKINDDEG